MAILDTSLGAILIGTFLNVWLYGILVTQVTLYYSVYKNDATWVKLLVAWMMLLDTLNTIFDMGFVYRYTITLFGNLPAQLHSHWSPLITVSIAATTQGFFAWRINRLTGCKWLSWGIGLVLAIQFAAGASTTAGAFRVVDFTRFDEMKAQISLWLVTSAVADTAITIILSWYLHAHRTGFSKTDDIITRLIRITVQTGLITTVWALVDLIMYLTVPNPLHLLFNLPLPKLYSNSLLSTLNARGGWGNDSMGGDGSTTGGISVPVSIKTPRSHEHQLTIPQNLQGPKGVDHKEYNFEMMESSNFRGARVSGDIERDGYSAHEIKPNGDWSLGSDVQIRLPAEAYNPGDDN
ncbi:unnamed protein product [Rhizoctonia solani]|uniref:DUF6534 domain-containing protein n=1 Tax=Rhizoctonia solani TaxID=456999 RepID=A0A8H3E7G9_9AGAM|nr:unnamed protein product [Rhizoctonia solani]